MTLKSKRSGLSFEVPFNVIKISGSLQTTPESEEPSTSNSAFAASDRGYTKLSSLPHGISPTSVMAGAMISPSSEVSSVDPESLRIKQDNSISGGKFDHQHKNILLHVDEFTKLLCPDDARMLVDLLKLAVAGRCSDRSRESLSAVLSALGATSTSIGN